MSEPKDNREKNSNQNVIRYWKYLKMLNASELRQIYDAIVERFNQNRFSVEEKNEIALLLYNEFPEENEVFQKLGNSSQDISKWLKQQEKEHNLWNVYRLLYWKYYCNDSTAVTVQVDKYLVSVMEKYELYMLALKLIERVLEHDDDEVAVRTLFRVCRKTEDYSAADKYLKTHPQVETRQGFNIQYELFYYYLENHDESGVKRSLEYIRKSASGSVPISRTLQNFYVQLGMIDEAARLREHIARLEHKKNANGNKTSKGIKGVEEEKETSDVFWDTISNMVSEQEHNRQLIAIKELLKGFSHELGQPITNIRYGVQLYQMKMERGLDTVDELQELLKSILEQTTRVKNLLNRFAPVVSSKSELTEFNCIEHIKSVFQDMEMRLETLEVCYEILGENNFILYGDSVQFDQVLYNLIGNAIDELREKTGKRKITVELKKHRDSLWIHFRDNGRGIPEQDIKKIFTPFYSTKDKEKSDGGEGLGLYIVWNILKMFNGKIRVNTDYKDGAEFLIVLPKGEKKDV